MNGTVTAQAYGPHPDQFVEWQGEGGRPLALLHGGYWRAAHTLAGLRPLAQAAAGRGWRVANIEYRRGTGWRDTFADVAAALRAVTSESGSAPVAIGHSAGGHLALREAGSTAAVIALAPVLDPVLGYREGVGEGAVAEFLGGSPEEAPEAYAMACLAPGLRVPVLVVHGADDERVPVGHSRDWVGRARAEGAPVRYEEPPSLGHLDVVDPAGEHWPGIWAWAASSAQ